MEKEEGRKHMGKVRRKKGEGRWEKGELRRKNDYGREKWPLPSMTIVPPETTQVG